VDYFLLAGRYFGVSVGSKLCLGERLWVVPMGVQGQHHRRAFLHHSYPRMTAAVNAPLVAFRQPKPAFQIQVVARPIAATATSEKPWFETGHHTPHLLTDRIRVGQQPPFQLREPVLPFRTTFRRWLQQQIHLTNRGDQPSHVFLRRNDQAPSLVDATG